MTVPSCGATCWSKCDGCDACEAIEKLEARVAELTELRDRVFDLVVEANEVRTAAWETAYLLGQARDAIWKDRDDLEKQKRCEGGHRQLWQGTHWEACRTCAREKKT